MGKIKTYWRNKAANAFFVVGQHAKTKEERIWGYRNSLLAGNETAEKFYVIANIECLFSCRHIHQNDYRIVVALFF